MRLLDRILLMLAATSLLAIIMIFFTDEVNSVYLPEEERKVHANKVVEGPNDGMIVLGAEVDQVIEKYFEKIRKSPGAAEEDARLVSEEHELEGSIPSLFSNVDIIQPDKDKNSLKEELKGTVLQSQKNGAETAKPEPLLKTQKTQEKEEKKKQNVVKKRTKTSRHVVQRGESLWRISQRYNVPVYAIVSANPGKARKIIKPGEVLKIPPGVGVFHRVRRGQTLSGIAKKYRVALSQVRSANSITGTHLSIGQKVFIPGGKPLPVYKWISKPMFRWPLQGRLTSTYGWRRHPFSGRRQFHPGIDLAAKWGTKIYAAAKGVVVFAGRAGPYGKLVVLRHRDGYFSAYAHCSRLRVRKGKYVKKGQFIAKVGSTGTSTGSHLHFEVRRYKKKINPFTAMRNAKVKVKVPAS